MTSWLIPLRSPVRTALMKAFVVALLNGIWSAASSMDTPILSNNPRPECALLDNSMEVSPHKAPTKSAVAPMSAHMALSGSLFCLPKLSKMVRMTISPAVSIRMDGVMYDAPA